MMHTSSDYTLTVTTLPGLEEVLASELLRLGARDIQPGVRNVQCTGDLGFIYKANLGLRTAIRILVPVEHFRVRNEKELYKHLYNVPWEDYLSLDQTFSVDASVQSDQFRNSHYIRLRTKDAVADRFRDRTGQRPSVDKRRPQIGIHIHINRERVTVSLDSSGAPLFKRGYREKGVKAPLSEALAAGLLQVAGWKGGAHLVDPMCGSGTFLIEGALIALNLPPQLHRDDFSFLHWRDFDGELYATIREGLMSRAKDTPMQFIGYDKSPVSVEAARTNVKKAMLEDYIRIEQKDFFDTEKPEGPTFVIFNPPYDERLAIRQDDFYPRIGDTFKQSYAGATAWMLTADLQGLKRVGLRTSARIPIINSTYECRFVRYDLYEGSRKGGESAGS